MILERRSADNDAERFKSLANELASEMPMEEPREFRLAVNVRTAETLRVVVPPTILVRADNVYS